MTASILITGASGYIGSFLAHYLTPRYPGRVYLADILPPPFPWPGGVASLDGDLTTPAGLDAVRKLAPRILINCAGLSGERQCREAGWDRTFAVNAALPGQLRRAAPGALLVQASTASILASTGPALTPYAYSKEWAEDSLADEPGTVLLRFGTVFGYNDAVMRWDLPMHAMIRDAVERRCINVRGPALRRPWLHITDLAAVIGRIVQDFDRGLSPAYPFPVPLATFNMTLGDVADTIAKTVPGVPGVEIVMSDPGPDSRDYCLPAIRIARGDRWDIASEVAACWNALQAV